jgi:hypothetical protein
VCETRKSVTEADKKKNKYPEQKCNGEEDNYLRVL